MDPLTGAAVVMGGGAIINGITSYLGNKQTNEGNMKLAEYQHQKNMEMWDKNNQYNSPQNQMARLKAAGLNPNLVYGSGAVANSSGQIPQYQAPKVDWRMQSPIDMNSVLQTYQSLALNNAQVDNIKSQTEKTKTENLGLISDLVGKQEGAKNAPKLAELGLSQKSAENEEAQKRLVLQKLDIELKQMERDWAKQGMRSGDQIQWRMLFKALDEIGINPSEAIQGLSNGFKESIREVVPEYFHDNLPDFLKKAQPKKGGKKNEKP